MPFTQPSGSQDVVNLPTDPEMLLLLFSEWLDQQGQMVGHERAPDLPTHEDLAREFIADLTARRTVGEATVEYLDGTVSHGYLDPEKAQPGVGTRLREATDRLADDVEAGTYHGRSDEAEGHDWLSRHGLDLREHRG